MLSYLNLTVGVSWFLTDLVKPRTPSSPTSSLPSALVRLRPALLLVVSALPNIMLCSASSMFQHPIYPLTLLNILQGGTRLQLHLRW